MEQNCYSAVLPMSSHLHGGSSASRHCSLRLQSCLGAAVPSAVLPKTGEEKQNAAMQGIMQGIVQGIVQPSLGWLGRCAAQGLRIAGCPAWPVQRRALHGEVMRGSSAMQGLCIALCPA